ncbi:MAG TPA: ATP-binding protein [Puia sp.]|nr:ATP-binding protein [Puia sp.]
MPEKFSEVTLILFASTLIILLLTGLIVVSLFINQKRKYRYHREKFELKTNFEGELLRAHLEIQSQAFESISRELHDNVGTLISIAMVHMRSLSVSETERDKISEVDSLLNEAMDSLRDISRSINPENINRLGWQKSFVAELDRIRKTNLFKVHYSEEGLPFTIELQKQIILFRILQETLNNIVKHSGGNHIYSHIRFLDNLVSITIKDDGKGFKAHSIDLPGEGSGIKNMRSRAAMLPAILEIESEVGGGTVVRLSYKESTVQT